MVTLEPQLDIQALNPIFETRTPQQIVDWAVGEFGDELVMTSSFGAESAALLHMASAALPQIKVVMIDTGYLFPETHQFMEQLRHRLDLNIWTYRTRNDPISWLHSAGEENPTWRKDIQSCCAINKNEPMERAMRDLQPKAWLRGVRRHQAETRKAMSIVEWSKRYNCHAVSPLLNWTSQQMHDYMQEHDLPYHPLREQGYASIGCNPISCTRAIRPGEDPRAGRWSGTDKVECGINLNQSLDSAQL